MTTLFLGTEIAEHYGSLNGVVLFFGISHCRDDVRSIRTDLSRNAINPKTEPSATSCLDSQIETQVVENKVDIVIDARLCEVLKNVKAPRLGLEPIDVNTLCNNDLQHMPDSRAAEYGAANDDLQFIVEQWPNLSLEIQREILGIVENHIEGRTKKH